MNKAQALHLFWSRFLPAIDESSAYDKGVLAQQGFSFPYITYEVAESNLGLPQQLTGSIWYRSTSWEDAELKAKEIADWIGWGGKVLPVDGGYIKIMLPNGGTIYRRMADPDDSLRRIVFTIAVDFLTAT